MCIMCKHTDYAYVLSGTYISSYCARVHACVFCVHMLLLLKLWPFLLAQVFL